MIVDDDDAPHARFPVAGDQAYELQVGHIGELPDQLGILSTWDRNRVGVIMLHVGVFAHPLLVFCDLVKGAEKELVIQSTQIADKKPDNRSALDVECVRLEKHVAAFRLPDGQFNRPVDRGTITGFPDRIMARHFEGSGVRLLALATGSAH